MKKILALSAFVMILFLGGIFVSAVLAQNKMTVISDISGNKADYDLEINIVEGWNLISGTPILGTFPGDDYADDVISSASEIKRENIKAAYFYSRDYNKYYEVYPTADEFQEYLLNAGSSPENGAYIAQSPMWVYSDKSGILRYTREDVPKYYNEIALENGWNFITIEPGMFDSAKDYFSWDNIKGSGAHSCSYQKIYYWNPTEQNWHQMDSLLQVRSYDFDDFLGNGMIVKVSDDCGLGPTSSQINPPAIP